MFSEDLVKFAGKRFDVGHDLLVKITEQADQLTGLGLKVTQVILHDESMPPRFYITFPQDKPMFKMRILLEKEGYDVGQLMGQKELGFYAAKRTVASKGWED